MNQSIVMNPPGPAMSPEEIASRRRRARRGALWLAGFALLVYFGFIIAFINR